jgi:hypothetical protein
MMQVKVTAAELSTMSNNMIFHQWRGVLYSHTLMMR